jgi:hypothetical protein
MHADHAFLVPATAFFAAICCSSLREDMSRDTSRAKVGCTVACRPCSVLSGAASLPSAPLGVPTPKHFWGNTWSPIPFVFLKLVATCSCNASAAERSGYRASACMQIFKQLTTPEIALPWEEGRISPQDARKLGKFRKPILKLLQREPSERGTVLQFCKSMSEIFCSTPGGSTVQKDTMPVRW